MVDVVDGYAARSRSVVGRRQRQRQSLQLSDASVLIGDTGTCLNAELPALAAPVESTSVATAMVSNSKPQQQQAADVFHCNFNDDDDGVAPPAGRPVVRRNPQAKAVARRTSTVKSITGRAAAAPITTTCPPTIRAGLKTGSASGLVNSNQPQLLASSCLKCGQQQTEGRELRKQDAETVTKLQQELQQQKKICQRLKEQLEQRQQQEEKEKSNEQQQQQQQQLDRQQQIHRHKIQRIHAIYQKCLRDMQQQMVSAAQQLRMQYQHWQQQQQQLQQKYQEQMQVLLLRLQPEQPKELPESRKQQQQRHSSNQQGQQQEPSQESKMFQIDSFDELPLLPTPNNNPAAVTISCLATKTAIISDRSAIHANRVISDHDAFVNEGEENHPSVATETPPLSQNEATLQGLNMVRSDTNVALHGNVHLPADNVDNNNTSSTSSCASSNKRHRLLASSAVLELSCSPDLSLNAGDVVRPQEASPAAWSLEVQDCAQSPSARSPQSLLPDSTSRSPRRKKINNRENRTQHQRQPATTVSSKKRKLQDREDVSLVTRSPISVRITRATTLCRSSMMCSQQADAVAASMQHEQHERHEEVGASKGKPLDESKGVDNDVSSATRSDRRRTRSSVASPSMIPPAAAHKDDGLAVRSDNSNSDKNIETRSGTDATRGTSTTCLEIIGRNSQLRRSSSEGRRAFKSPLRRSPVRCRSASSIYPRASRSLVTRIQILDASDDDEDD